MWFVSDSESPTVATSGAPVPPVTSEMADDNGALGNYAGPWPATKDVTLFPQEDRADPDYTWKLLTKSPRSPKLPKTAAFTFTTGTNTESTVNANPRANAQWLWFETDPLARDTRIFGNVEITLPAGVRVENDGQGFLGSFSCHVAPGAMPMVGTAPIVRVTGRVVLGNVEVMSVPTSLPTSVPASGADT